MTSYAQRREARRRQRMIGAAVFVVLLGASVGLRVGALTAAASIVGLILLVLVVQWTVVLGQRRTAPPASCPAQIPADALRKLGMPIRAARAEGELTGRLQVTGDVVQWQPGSGAQRLGAQPASWPRTANPLRFQPLWGTIPLGHLEVGAAPSTVDIWLRDPRPVRDALGLG